MLHTLEGFACTGTAPSSTRAPAQNTTRARNRLSPLSASLSSAVARAASAPPRAVIRGRAATAPAPRTHRHALQGRGPRRVLRGSGAGGLPLPVGRARGCHHPRRDGAFAYQLAVVVDDALQGVTDVVRGADLLDSTPWQLALQGALQLPTPRYAHLPLITEPGGAKLAKSRCSVALDPAQRGRQLQEALALLGQEPPVTLKFESPQTVLDWACAHWIWTGSRACGRCALRPQSFLRAGGSLSELGSRCQCNMVYADALH